MKLLINKMLKNNFISNLRNLLNIKPIHMSLEGLAGSSVSDAFAWRTDNGFTTKFKYSDILNIFYKINNSWVEFHFYSRNNKLLKIKKVMNLDSSNEIDINPNFLDGLEDYGSFYVYHYSRDKNIGKDIISNRCYLGYSQNNNLFSFVHGNTLATSTQVSQAGDILTNIVKTTFFKNHEYKLQKYFKDFDKSELFLSNPTSNLIKFTLDQDNYKLNGGCSMIIDISQKKIINIKSNCLFFRPTIFSYKNQYLDVHHG
jgi:hypothetical protein